ncbi:hypothetical protein Tco_1185412 [Tanacetum coccineum]
MKRASKGYTGENISLFPTMIVQGLVVQGEGSTHPIESHHIPTSALSTSQPPISPTSRRTNKQGSVVLQPRSPTQSPVADKAASRGLIKKVKKLENKVKSSQARRRARIIVSDNEDDLKDPSKQGKKIAEIDQDPAILLVQHDAKIQGRNVHDIDFDFDFDTAKEVSTAEKDVSTAEPVFTVGAAVTTASVVAVSTASPTRRVSTTDDITMAETLVYIRKSATKDKSKGKMDEYEYETAQTKTKLQSYQSEKKHMRGYTLQQLRGYSFDKIKNLFETTIRRVHTFVLIESEIERVIHELAAGSLKRDAEEELDQESSKRQKIGESSEPAEEPKDKEEELSQEELQQMMIIILEQGMNVEALQTKYPIIDWEIYTEGTRNLVKEKFNSTEPTDDKEREIWVELKRLFKPDTDDELWKLQKHIHDLTWKLYDSCGVHHVSTEKGIDIYMLVEKEYPLSRGTLTLMLVAKLLVDQDNKMSRELLRKIFMQAERLRR